MSEMFERVATVIGQALATHGITEPAEDKMALNFAAGVVFQALRGATPEILEAFYQTPRGKAAKPLDHWEAMIDAARKRHA